MRVQDKTSRRGRSLNRKQTRAEQTDRVRGVISFQGNERYTLALIPERHAETRTETAQVATAVNAGGENHVEDLQFEFHVKTLEVMLNHYLETGKMISNEEAIRNARVRR